MLCCRDFDIVFYRYVHCGWPNIQALLQSPGILEQLQGTFNDTGTPKNTTPPLVASAMAFALRIDPPEIAKETTQRLQDKIVNQGDRRSEIDIPKPPVNLTPKFDLLATIQYESAPEKSLALFRSGKKQEWFRRGATVGRHKIKDIKDGRVLLMQSDQKTIEMVTPPKPRIASILKGS